MKVKKEYIILAVVIVALAAYLVLKRSDRVHYDLPDPGKVETEEISKVEIRRGTVTTVLIKKAGAWYLSPQSWRADPQKVADMLAAIGGLKPTDLASEAKAYDRYLLDAANKVSVRAYAGTALKRGFDVGKPAPTSQHTFIRLTGNDNVYLAGGDLRRIFDIPPSGLRDLVVLSFTPSEITGVSLEGGGRTMTLTRLDASPAKARAKDAPLQVSWQNDRGGQVDKLAVDTLLAVLSKVYCEGYLDDAVRATLSKPVLAFRLKGTRDYELLVYAKTEEKVPALSSGSRSPFALPGYKLEGLQKSLEDIMGKPSGRDQQ